MILKILKKDFLRKKVITAAVFIFIMLSAVLISSGISMIIDLGNSMGALFENSNAPHFVQYHLGEINQAKIERWSEEQISVKIQQTAESINMDESNVFLGNSLEAESSGIMEMGFVQQNKSFDFLLDLQSQVIYLSPGEIAVPIYYMQENNLEIGDNVKIENADFSKTYIIKAFVRDVQMNPSIISSKRFVMSDSDFAEMKQYFNVIEYQIGFQLNNLDDADGFLNSYRASGLPAKGPTIEYSLLQMVNALTDGLVAALIILISFLLNVIALLCLRFTILATIEEDYKEIGVMKAIGIEEKIIKRIYLSKYIAMGAGASLAGYIISLFLNKIFSANIMLYIGSAPKSILQKIVPFLAAFLIFMIVVFFCKALLRRFKKITALEALRLGNTGDSYRAAKKFPIHKKKILNINIFLGLRDVFLRFRLYGLLLFVFFISTFIIIVPVNFLNTIQSPEFMSYMGMGRCDLLIDLRQTENVKKRFESMVDYIQRDEDVEKFAPSISCNFKIINKDGYEEILIVGTGDPSIFPLDYLEGTAPVGKREIALSDLVARELEKGVGDTLEMVVGEETRKMSICGIYQDITNGGKTAKALIEPNHDTALWYMLSVNISADIQEKMDEYSKAFYPAKITNIDGYIKKTFANTIDQLKLLTTLAILISVLISILITSLFLKMLIAKDYSQIVIMKSIGYSLKNIRAQYISRALLVLNLGIILGSVLANTLGEKLIGAVLSMRGASQIEFIINPLYSYILFPLGLISVVTISTLFNLSSLKKFNILDINAE